LIDGKPSALVSVKGGIGLQQLQASMVERVEIITNPSARYEAEGMAGIINIILKKDRRQGFNGTIELVGGDPLNLGAAFNLNYRHKKINFFVNYGVTYRKVPYKGSLHQEL
jgi:outer membrane cobalamin receptor